MKGRRKHRFFCFVLIGFGLFIAVLGLQGIMREQSLQANMAIAEGRVLAVTRERTEPPSEIQRQLESRPDGLVSIHVDVDYDGHRKLFVLDDVLAVGDAVTIRYDRNDPGNAQLISNEAIPGTGSVIAGTKGGAGAIAIGLILIILGGYLGLRKPKRP